MAPVLELETETECRRAIGTRTRVLIAAAVTAVLGSGFRILETIPAQAVPRRDLERSRPFPKTGHARLLVKASTLAFRRHMRRRNVRLRITLEDGSYDVGVEILPEPEFAEIEDLPMPAVPDSVLRPPPQLDTRPEDKICRSPIAGIVVGVTASPRQTIRQDDPLLTIEAMKMLNTIGAPVAGMVAEILVKPGDAVKTGQVLCMLS